MESLMEQQKGKGSPQQAKPAMKPQTKPAPKAGPTTQAPGAKKK